MQGSTIALQSPVCLFFFSFYFFFIYFIFFINSEPLCESELSKRLSAVNESNASSHSNSRVTSPAKSSKSSNRESQASIGSGNEDSTTQLKSPLSPSHTEDSQNVNILTNIFPLVDMTIGIMMFRVPVKCQDLFLHLHHLNFLRVTMIP